MGFIIFLKGVLIGFIMAIPLGPIGIMCIRKTLTEGRLRGLVIGLGAATADLLYSSVAAFGLTLVLDVIVSQKVWMRLLGGGLLLLLGVKIFRKEPADPKFHIENSSIMRSYLITVFLTLTNPLAIFAFIAVFAALDIGYDLSNYSATVLVSGVFVGSLLWFLLLSSVVSIFKKKLEVSGLRWVNKIAGSLIIVSGFIAFGSLL